MKNICLYSTVLPEMTQCLSVAESMNVLIHKYSSLVKVREHIYVWQGLFVGDGLEAQLASGFPTFE